MARSEEEELLRQIAIKAGYRFETDSATGVELIYGPDEKLAVSPPAPPMPPSNMPHGITMDAKGACYRTIPAIAGGLIQARVCEDCWRIIPRYIDFPAGLISPESDGDAGGNFAKTCRTVVGDKIGVEHLAKTVCLPCYLAAYARVYPTAIQPALRSDATVDVTSYVPEPEAEYIAGPKGLGR